MDNVKELLQNVYSISNSWKRFLDKRSESFNIFEALYMETEEARLHNPFLAELLNPKGSHGKESTFLRHFIDLLDNQELASFDCGNATVECEKWIGSIDTDTSKGGRIDAFIEDYQQQIIIENKIYAEDQHQQLLRYRNAYPNATILYLTLYGDEPNEISTDSKKINYNTVSYNRLILPWLDRCIKETAENPTLREVLIQYRKTVKGLLGYTREREMEEEIIQELRKSENNIEATFAIAGSLEGFKTQMMDQLWDNLEAIGGYVSDEDWTKAESGFYYRKEGWKNFEIAFVFETSKLRNFYYGIRFLKSSDLNKKQKEILRGFEPGKSNEYYAWWNFTEYAEDWNTSAEPWKAIQNENLLKYIEEKRAKLEGIVDQLEAEMR